MQIKTGGYAMKDMIHYKGYYGSVHYSDDDQVFFGKIAPIFPNLFGYVKLIEASSPYLLLNLQYFENLQCIWNIVSFVRIHGIHSFP